MKAPVAALKAARESRPGGRINLQESQSTTAATRQIRLLHASKNLQQRLGSSSRTTSYCQEDALAGSPLPSGQKADCVQKNAAIRQLNELRTFDAPLVIGVARLIMVLGDICMRQDFALADPRPVPTRARRDRKENLRIRLTDDWRHSRIHKHPLA